jgi:hypothetical protein
VISDHALIRWLERQYGMPTEEYRRELETIAKPYIEAGAVGCRAGDMWLVINQGVVVTVITEKPSHGTRMAHSERNRR